MRKSTITFRVNENVDEVVVKIPSEMRYFPLAVLDSVDKDEAIFRAVKLRGTGSELYIGPKANVTGVSLNVVGDNNVIIIGDNCSLKGSFLIRGNNRIIFIGANTTFHSVHILCRNEGHVYIGKDCMFSSGIEVRTSDSHAIIDTLSNENVNKAQGVFVGDHVWVGKGVVLQKGSVVESDNIIAINSFVRGRFCVGNTIIAGTPAKVVRENRSWSRNEMVDPSTEDIYEWKKINLL